MSVRAPTFVRETVDAHPDAFQGQRDSVLISAETTKPSFAVFLYAFLVGNSVMTRTALCVYSSPEERQSWLEVVADVIKRRRAQPAVNVFELDSEEPPPLPYIAMVHCAELERRFPKRDAFAGVEMRPECALQIRTVARMYTVTDADHRAFAAFDTPVSRAARRPDDPYSVAYDYLVFSRGALQLDSVFYLNAVAVYFNRFLLDDVLDEYDDERVLHHAVCASERELLEPCEYDAAEDAYTLVMIDDARVNFAVLVDDDDDEASAAPIAAVAMPPLRSVIAWQSVEQPCAERDLDLSSRVSVMWVHHPELANAAQRGWARSSKKMWNSSSLAITDEHYSVTKTMMIYQYVWSNYTRKFFILCPYVSKSHELHKLRNARALHPEDMLIGLLREEDTLIVYDTAFADEARLRLAETRCRLIFAAFSGTVEEESLARFLYMERGLTPPPLPNPLRLSPVRARSIVVDPKRIRLHKELTSIIFHDQRGVAHTTLYACMLATYDCIMAMANELYYSTEYAALLARTLDHRLRLHVAARADTLVCRTNSVAKQRRVIELVRHRQRVEQDGDRNALRVATRQMWTAVHNYYRITVPVVVSHIAGKQAAADLDAHGSRLVKANLERLIALNDWLRCCDEEFAVRITYNENATVLRQRIDNTEPPTIPSVDDRAPASLIECPYCDETFDSVHFYRQHKNIAHREDDDRSFHCGVCDVSIRGEWRYIKHTRSLAHFRRASDRPYRYACGVCGRTFDRGSSYWSHAVGCRNQDQLVQCEACAVQVRSVDLPAHQLSPEHQRKIAGPEQIYCQSCRVHCLPGLEMREHLASEAHMNVYIARGHIMPVTVALNRWYVLLAAAEKLIDPRGYYVDMELRRSLLMLPEAKDTVGEAAFPNYCTLLLISMVMPPAMRKFYFTADQRSGMLAATVAGRTGIVGHYGTGDKTILLAEMFKHMNVAHVGHGFLAYVPSGLHATLVAYARHLDMKIVRSRASTVHLGRLGVYAAYRVSKINT